MQKRALLCISVLLFAATNAFSQQSQKKPPIAPQGAYSFMGLALGQPKAEAATVIAAMNSTLGELEQFEAPVCKTDAPGLSGPGLKYCHFSVKYAGLPAYSRSHSFTLLFVDDKLASITYNFDGNEYDAMVQAVVKKYGTPKTTQTVVMQNQMGASFRGRVYVWHNAVSTIRAKEYGTTLDRSAIDVDDVALMREFEKRARENGPKI
jgi:hypothetical protein